MGPPLFSDGNFARDGLRSNALDLLQWGRRFSATETMSHDLPCRPSARSLQWGRRFSATETCDSLFETHTSSSASMGPPLFSDGNAVQHIHWRSREEGLQWGRRFSATETGSPSEKMRLTSAGLQWGRRFSATETRMRFCDSARSLGLLQWGRRFSATETKVVVVGLSAHNDASMGPPLFSDGNNDEIVIHSSSKHASMGPPLFSDGNHVQARGVEIVVNASMGPPLFSDGNRPPPKSFERHELQPGLRGVPRGSIF